ncbi:hypothetical protein IQ226_02310 [Dolichospermum sp. LEGE 00240]|jgi:hypothetical protein|uniref:DUF7734 family protein n=1 Tax=Dolichospermum sp. LEGE 00240 TaxID=1828603 RepID=UPI00187FFFB9|nr:hypothetical protein [Dolichospermum sp. LEGE 00240]MDM3844499.1 hypothetical protein [Aphanizomenon gracile PMC638.10]MDM3852480.1 hypothetical protein [Aphanizomenon gracile PMC627.10]MDM3857027.1 hypothetical protein [Aphanizomenon gracile PMC649.10]MDM3859472.1 hypothetical protein [Aphanizomenon gracile PMC644.10]MBE9248050.1 hypothetical protein [Dolichospermum sp. LEGE 00240]
MNNSISKRLEKYTIKKSQEVLIINVEIDNEPDQIAVFKGFSSSLMRPTAYDPDVPVLPDTATIITIDRIASPYNPDSPRYLQQDISWEDMQVLLSEVGV